MSDGIYAALSGAIAQSTLLETAANNLANASTDGYQRVRPVFQEMVSQAGGAAARGTSLVTVASTSVDTSAGAPRPTGRALDAALPEGVYLAVSTPRGERYTRAVSLTTSPEGELRTAGGAAVADESGAPLRIPPGAGDLTLTADGELRRAGAPVGRLRLVSFDRPGQLVQEGGTLLAARGATPTAASAALTLGSVEESNATMVGAMTELVTATRTFDAYQRVIDAFREADRRVVTSVPA